MKKVAVSLLILSSVLFSGCGLKIGFNVTDDAKCNLLCTGVI